MRTLLPALLLCVAVAAEEPPSEDAKSLVEKLSSDSAEKRDAAESKLVALGEPALAALDEAATSSKEEVASRAKRAAERIRENLEIAARIRELPKTFGRRKITFGGEGASGSAELTTVLESGEIVLEDRFEFTWEGNKATFVIRQVCIPNRYLMPKRIETKAEGGDNEMKTYTATFEGPVATIWMDGRKKVRGMSDATVTTCALLRLVGVLPQRKGAEFLFDSLEAEEIHFKPRSRLSCLGEEAVAVGVETVQAWKWSFENSASREQFLWVRDGVVIRALFDGRKVWEFSAK